MVAALGRLDDRRRPIAETYRLVAGVAESLGVPRPSYQAIRLLVHALRAGQDARVGAGELLLDIALHARPPEAALELLRPAEERSRPRRRTL